MGMDCLWTSRFRPVDGAFLEIIESSQLSFKYGHMGCNAKGHLSKSWAVRAALFIESCRFGSPFLLHQVDMILSQESDKSYTQVEQDGLPKEYSLDDHEVCLLHKAALHG